MLLVATLQDQPYSIPIGKTVLYNSFVYTVHNAKKIAIHEIEWKLTFCFLYRKHLLRLTNPWPVRYPPWRATTSQSYPWQLSILWATKIESTTLKRPVIPTTSNRSHPGWYPPKPSPRKKRRKNPKFPNWKLSSLPSCEYHSFIIPKFVTVCHNPTQW